MTGTATQPAPPPQSQYPHLPPGYAPGPQTRRRGVLGAAGGTIVFFFVLIIFGFVTSVFSLIFGIIGLAFLFSGEVVGALIGIVVVLLCIAVPGALFFGAWRVRPGRKPPQHFAVSASTQAARRGDEVTVHLEVSAPDQIGERLEYGLVCTGWYDDRQRHSSSSGSGHSSQTRRVAVEAVAWEHWVEAHRSTGVQSTTFRIPADAPFSYEGRCLSFAWRASAREPKRMAIDPRRDVPIWVSP